MTAKLYRVGIDVDRVAGTTHAVVFEDFGDGLMYCIGQRETKNRVVLASGADMLDAQPQEDSNGHTQE